MINKNDFVIISINKIKNDDSCLKKKKMTCLKE